MTDLTTLLSFFLKDLYAGTLGTTAPVTGMLVGDGSASAPSLSFASAPTTGVYLTSGNLTFSVGGTGRGQFDTGGHFYANDLVLDFTNADTKLVRDTANTLALKNSTTAQTFRVYGTTTGPKYLSVSHDGTNGVIDTAASSGALSLAPTNATSITTGKAMTVMSATSIPAGGTAGSGIMLSSTANFGIFFGSNTPSLSAAQGSLYLRSDGSSGTTRAYINTNGSTGWTSITTAA